MRARTAAAMETLSMDCNSTLRKSRASAHVLVADADPEARELVGRALAQAGFQAHLAADSPSADVAVAGVDIVVLDVTLCDESGLALCARWRLAGTHVPVLFVGARTTTHACVEALDAGGDDYLAKPFAVCELVARVRALGRRAPVLRPEIVRCDSRTLDFKTRRASLARADVALTAREWAVLDALASRGGRVATFDDLLERVWREASERTRGCLEVIVARVRRKLDVPGVQSIVRTVRGAGYALAMSSASDDAAECRAR